MAFALYTIISFLNCNVAFMAFARYACVLTRPEFVAAEERQKMTNATVSLASRALSKLLAGICDVTTRVMRCRVEEIARSMMQSSATSTL